MSDQPGNIVQLMVFDAAHNPLSGETDFGGLPVFNTGAAFSWPTCTSCRGAMMYLGKIRSDNQLILLFMCQNQPGLCDEWDADGGGNRALRFRPGTLAPVQAPALGEVVRGTAYGCKTVICTGDDYEKARTEWAESQLLSPSQVLGQLGGSPAWLQNPECPNCSHCNQPMQFVAQLEAGPDHATEMNFGGGCAYVFSCEKCPDSAKFLWQC